MLRCTGADSALIGLEARLFGKPHKTFLTYKLLHKVWNKAKQLMGVEGFTAYNPIWGNKSYGELFKLQQGLR